MSEKINVAIVGGAGGGLARLALEAMAKAGIVEVITTKEIMTKAEKTLEITRIPTAEIFELYEQETIPGTKRWRRENKKRY